MKKISCIIGTRPQLIKHAPLLKELEKRFSVQTINTLQHYQADLNEIFKEELYGNRPFVDLEMETAHLPPSARLGKMVHELSKPINKTKPDAILVYGDTDSTLAGALVANKESIKLIHIESGERSFNKIMPEESNRVITDCLSQIHFCSSVESIDNLRKENICENVFYSGDLMKDLLQSKMADLADPTIGDYLFCTIHRNYTKNNPDKLKELFEVLNSLPKKILFAVHPATLNTLNGHSIDLANYQNIQILPPLSYVQSITYQRFSSGVITDSGGVQKEAYWLKKPCFTIRKETEWKATLNGNWNQLLYEDLSRLPELMENIPDDNRYDETLYGNGEASVLIANKLSTLI
jgi:UDP-GlcNAc3NAcA epimerase